MSQVCNILILFLSLYYYFFNRPLESSHKDGRRILKYQARSNSHENAYDDFLNHKWVSTRPKHRKFLGPISKSNRVQNKIGKIESEDDRIFASLVIFDNDQTDSDSESESEDNATTNHADHDLENSSDSDEIVTAEDSDSDTEINFDIEE